MLLRGIAHVHSRYSWDGVHPLAEIVGFLRDRGLDFALMSEHDRGLGDADVAAFVAECRALSDHRFLVVPGIEYEATPDYVHMLAYNTRALIGAKETPALARAIRAAGGLAVLAHPHWRDGYTHVPEPTLDVLHGWEVWNGKADGGRAPRAESVRRHAGLVPAHPGLLPMAGADLHRLESYPDITFAVECGERSAEGLLRGLGAGRYTVAGRGFRFAATEPVPLPGGSLAVSLGAAARRFKQWAQRLDRGLARRGLRAPAPLYRLARRLLR